MLFRRAVLLALAVLAAPLAARAQPHLGEPIPALQGKDFDGAAFDLSSLKGKVVVVHLWATWCPACRAEMGALDAVAHRHGGGDLVILAPSADRKHDLPEARRILSAHAFRGVALATASLNGFGQPSVLPLTYVVDRKGVVRAVLGGEDHMLTAGEAEAAIAPLLAER
jgi:cytochrome c biogenesis protein CcmG/thiol:disulfide interchange protein DsbE